MKKDDAQRRAEELVNRVVTWQPKPGRTWLDLTVFGRFASAYSEEDMPRMAGFWRDAILPVVADAIRAAVAAEREANDRIMTDLLGKTEAECEMWRQGAEAMRELAARLITSVGLLAIPNGRTRHPATTIPDRHGRGVASVADRPGAGAIQEGVGRDWLHHPLGSQYEHATRHD